MMKPVLIALACFTAINWDAGGSLSPRAAARLKNKCLRASGGRPAV